MFGSPQAFHSSLILVGESIGLVELTAVLEQPPELVDGKEGLLVLGAQGGSLSLDATYSDGARFVVQLPVAQPGRG